MKRSLLLFTLLPLLSIAQYDYLKLDNRQVYFEKKYLVDSASADNIRSMLSGFVPTIRTVTGFYNSGDVITATFKDAYIDYRMFGGTWLNTDVILNHPFTANIAIVWKNGAYKVTVSSIIWRRKEMGDIDASDYYTIKKNTEWATGESMLRSGHYVEKYLDTLFVLQKTRNDW